jgi:hypothetical protein
VDAAALGMGIAGVVLALGALVVAVLALARRPGPRAASDDDTSGAAATASTTTTGKDRA